MSAVAHRGNSRQRSTSVAFGAKRTLIKPRCRRGGAAHLLRRAMHWCLQQVPRPAADMVKKRRGRRPRARVWLRTHLRSQLSGV